MRIASKGFTLIELLIVVAIIAILAAIAVPNFLEAQTRTKVSRSKNDMRALAGAIQANLVDRALLPIDFWDDDLSEARSVGRDIFGVPIFQNRRGGVAGILVPLTTPIAYISSLPDDPFATGPGGRSTGITGPELVSNDQLPPHTYFYVDNDSRFEGLDSNAIYGLKDNEWTLQGIGPNARYNRSTGILAFYDPTNGTISEGNIIYHSRTGFEPYLFFGP